MPDLRPVMETGTPVRGSLAPPIRPKDDNHFYMDNASMEEVSAVLRVLDRDIPQTCDDIAHSLTSIYGVPMQSDHSYSPRKLWDLGLAEPIRVSRKRSYRLTAYGEIVQTIQSTDEALCPDLLHYLHLTLYGRAGYNRKNLWSYRRCCEALWSEGYNAPNGALAARIQGQMADEFPELDWGARMGSRFDATGVGRVKRWIACLRPSPLAGRGERLLLRQSCRPELALLAIDHVYRARGYRYGDGVLMGAELVDQVAGVFFLDPECAASLLRTAARTHSALAITDTLAGPSVRLKRPFTIEDL